MIVKYERRLVYNSDALLCSPRLTSSLTVFQDWRKAMRIVQV